jgi:predicted nucleic acid-binding protein
VIAEVWRGGRGQEHIIQALKYLEPVDCDEAIARRAGILMKAVGGNETIDAIVVASAERHGCAIATGDPDDLAPMAERAIGVKLVPR